jgi:hypothetical protein
MARYTKLARSSETHRQELIQSGEVGAVRHLHLQHHDRYDYDENAVTECFQPVFPMTLYPAFDSRLSTVRGLKKTPQDESKFSIKLDSHNFHPIIIRGNDKSRPTGASL